MTRRELMKRAAVAAGVVAGPALVFQGIRRYHGKGDVTRIVVPEEERFLNAPRSPTGWMRLTETPGPRQPLVQGNQFCQATGTEQRRIVVARYYLPDVEPFQFTPFEVGDRVYRKGQRDGRVEVVTAKNKQQHPGLIPGEGEWVFELDGGYIDTVDQHGNLRKQPFMHTWASMSISYEVVG